MKRLTSLALVLGMFCGSALHAQSKQAMFIPANMVWKESPVTEGIQLAEDAELFIFYDDHSFAYLSGVLLKDEVTGAISICAACGFSSEKGSWRASSASTIAVRFRVAHSDIKWDRRPPWKRESWHLRGGTSPFSASGGKTLKVELVPFDALANPEVVVALLRENE